MNRTNQAFISPHFKLSLSVSCRFTGFVLLRMYRQRQWPKRTVGSPQLSSSLFYFIYLCDFFFGYFSGAKRSSHAKIEGSRVQDTQLPLPSPPPPQPPPTTATQSIASLSLRTWWPSLMAYRSWSECLGECLCVCVWVCVVVLASHPQPRPLARSLTNCVRPHSQMYLTLASESASKWKPAIINRHPRCGDSLKFYFISSISLPNFGGCRACGFCNFSAKNSKILKTIWRHPHPAGTAHFTRAGHARGCCIFPETLLRSFLESLHNLCGILTPWPVRGFCKIFIYLKTNWNATRPTHTFRIQDPHICHTTWTGCCSCCLISAQRRGSKRRQKCGRSAKRLWQDKGEK